MNVKPNVRVGWIIAALIMGMILSALDATVVATAMPTIVNQLGDFSLYSWIFSIYMMMTILGMPLFGKFADQYGRTKTYLIGMGLFMLGSLLCGLSVNMPMLIISRGIQGIGAGAVVPVTLTIVGDLFTPEKRAKMQGIFGMLFGIASVLGPSVGGFLVDKGDWTWAFYINLPFGLLGMLFIGLFLPESTTKRNQLVDWKGIITLVLGTSVLLIDLVLVGHSDPSLRIEWNSFPSLALCVIGLTFLAGFIRIEAQAKDPIVPLFLFRNKVVALVCAVAFFTGIAMYGAIIYIPFFLQKVLGDNATVAGNALLPLMISFVIGSIIGGRLLLLLTYRSVLAIGMFLIALGFFLFATMHADTSRAAVSTYMWAAGTGLGVVIPILTIAMQEAVDKQWRGSMTSASSFFRMFGGVFGASLMAALMSTRLQQGLYRFEAAPASSSLESGLTADILLQGQASGTLPPEMMDTWMHVLTSSLQQVFILGGVLSFVGFTIALGMGTMKLKRDQKRLQV
ncbi:MDR family MFS transporter [Brevibacillus porteri]|uniref:MFS transporter n=1 Tax=Brevibacillus porteri TaxID=2126350 RepID=A0ABX5FVA3_9BACL|nr:MDR family MFS transporter [Brevibacillus porteri]MED1798836.1 MDR family MFS transporter [Brevibacillus porteri]MED2131519.1 MDR family MFS transporter [Brevibacillus porteri]MED2744072.1 MDR family MFS transporter [Brevibacillus porteri]MED2813286.1 MDR family MFS transporter [Brevibacillus porteri]MED2896604.1 MDR family MFS transporter [Brevibacillus porteri]